MVCKKMRTKYNYTPDDYEISFPIEEIPQNIDVQNVKELTLQLQDKMQLGKTIHIILEEKNEDIENLFDIYTSLSISFENRSKDISIL